MIRLHDPPRTIYHRTYTAHTCTTTPNRHPNQKKTVEHTPTAVDKNKKITTLTEGKPNTHSKTINDKVDTNTPIKQIYNNNTSNNKDTSNRTKPSQPLNNITTRLTMSTPGPPTGSGPRRRRFQRFKRGGHQM